MPVDEFLVFSLVIVPLPILIRSEYLHLPAEVVPETLKKKAVTEGKRFGGSAEGGNSEQSDRTAYRGPPSNHLLSSRLMQHAVIDHIVSYRVSSL